MLRRHYFILFISYHCLWDNCRPAPIDAEKHSSHTRISHIIIVSLSLVFLPKQAAGLGLGTSPSNMGFNPLLSSQLQAAVQFQQQQQQMQLASQLDHNTNPFATFGGSSSQQFNNQSPQQLLNHPSLSTNPFGQPQLQATASGGMRNYSSLQDIASDEDDSDEDRF